MNTRLNQVFLAVLSAGIIITGITNAAVRNARASRAAALSETGQESIAALPTAGAEDVGSDREKETEPVIGPGARLQNSGAASSNAGRSTVNTLYEEFRSKFTETERASYRGEFIAPGNNAEKNSAAIRLRYWETQLSLLYRTIMELLPEEEAAVLAREQQDWKLKRNETAAAKARSASGKNSESTDYTMSCAAETRDRAYALLERYKELLSLSN